MSQKKKDISGSDKDQPATGEDYTKPHKKDADNSIRYERIYSEPQKMANRFN